MRIIINTGKGGVGKTTVSALTSLNIARKYKTLLVSTDYAHSLGDLFGIKLGDEPSKINDNLYALEINPIKESKKSSENLHSYIKDVMMKNTVSEDEIYSVLSLPGLEDIFALLRILEEYESNQYESIVVDGSPTGETLSLLSMGEKLNNLSDTLVPLIKRVNNLIGSFVEKKTTVKKPKDIVFDEFIALSKRLYKLQQILLDNKVTTIRLVTNTNKVVMNESFRTCNLLNMYGFVVDAVFINGIYPSSLMDTSYRKLLEEEDGKIDKITSFFYRQKIFPIYLQDEEINGLDKLKNLCETLYDSQDLSKIYTRYLPYNIEDIKGTRIITIDMPFGDDADIEVKRIDDDIQITYLNHARRFRLTDNLISRRITSYELKDKKLRIMMDY